MVFVWGPGKPGGFRGERSQDLHAENRGDAAPG